MENSHSSSSLYQTCEEIQVLIKRLLADKVHPPLPKGWNLEPIPEYRSWIDPPEAWLEAEFSPHYILPDPVKCLWQCTGGVKLFCEIHYHQWGIVLWSPSQSRIQTGEWRELYPDKIGPADLMIGEFWGDTDGVLIRCDPSKADFGHVVIARPIDQREDWPKVATSLIEFLKQLLAFPGEKYWELESKSL